MKGVALEGNMPQVEQEEYIRQNYKSTPIKRMAKVIGRSQTFVRGYMLRNGLQVPREVAESRKRVNQFKKGRVSHNKGKKQVDFMSADAIKRSSQTRFKKGHKPHNTRKNHDISRRTDKNGYDYMYIRLCEGFWVLYHRFLWEQEFGPIPKGVCIQFKDGNQLNCKLDNLYAIAKSDQAVVNKLGGSALPYELRKSIELTRKLKKQIDEKQDTRPQ